MIVTPLLFGTLPLSKELLLEQGQETESWRNFGGTFPV
jgi:hypothetical protein